MSEDPVPNICPPHLYLRFICGDFLYETTIRIGHVMVEGECIDCEAYENGNLPEAANPDPYMARLEGRR